MKFEALNNPDELDSEDDADSCDMEAIIEDIPLTPKMPTPIPVQSTSAKLPDLVMSPVEPAVAPEIIRKEEINKSEKGNNDQQQQNQSKKHDNKPKKGLQKNLILMSPSY